MMSQRLIRKNHLLNEILATWRAAENDEEDDDEEGEEEEDSEDPEGDDEDKSSTETVSKAEYDKLMARMKAADKAKAAAETKAKEYEDKDKSELQLAQQEVEDLRSENETTAQELARARVELAFFKENTYAWKNPNTALRLVDLSEVGVDEDGKVTGMKEALKALAESDPYLLSDDDDGSKEPNTPSSGGGTRRKNNKPKTPDRNALGKLYPAVRR